VTPSPPRRQRHRPGLHGRALALSARRRARARCDHDNLGLKLHPRQNVQRRQHHLAKPFSATAGEPPVPKSPLFSLPAFTMLRSAFVPCSTPCREDVPLGHHCCMAGPRCCPRLTPRFPVASRDQAVEALCHPHHDRDPKPVNCKVEPFESLSTKTFTLLSSIICPYHDPSILVARSIFVYIIACVVPSCRSIYLSLYLVLLEMCYSELS